MAEREYSIKEKAFFYSCLLDSLVLFSSEKEYFESVISPIFKPIFELDTEFSYAFLPIVFENACDYGEINEDTKSRLQKFKEAVENLPSEIWRWEALYANNEWLKIRKESISLLEELGEEHRKFED